MQTPVFDEFQKSLATALMMQGSFLSNQVEVLAAYNRSLAILEQLAGTKPNVAQFHNHLTINHNNIGSRLFGLGRFSEVLASNRGALSAWQRVADANLLAPDLIELLRWSLHFFRPGR